MDSKIARAIKLKNAPVAILWTDRKPEHAIQFKEGIWGCVISMLNAASKGRTAVFEAKTATCGGGSTGLGFTKFEPGSIEYFLSTGEVGGREGEFYRITPQFARAFVESLPDIITPTKYAFLSRWGKWARRKSPKP